MKSHLRQFFCAVLTSALIASTVTFSFAASPHPSEETAADIEKASITLSDYNYTHSFTGRKAITAIAETYGLQNPEAIEEIIYVPIQQITVSESGEGSVPAAAPSVLPRSSSKNKYYAKKKGNEEKKGELLRSSWYNYPGGRMKISEKISTMHTFSAAGGVDVDGKTVKATLKAAYEFSITKKRTISDEQDVVVKKGCKRNARAYVNNKIYYFNIWKKRILLKDKYCGKGHITRPVGVIFEIRKNQKK